MEADRITDDEEAEALMPIMVELLKGFRHKKEAELLQSVIDMGGMQRVLSLRLRSDLDFVALARYVHYNQGKRAEPRSREEQALIAAMDQVLDDMGTGGFAVCGATKAQARVALDPYLNDEERALHTPVEDARQLLKDVGL